jgi:hypothetical protein
MNIFASLLYVPSLRSTCKCMFQHPVLRHAQAMLFSSHKISSLMTITTNDVSLRVKITSQAVTAWWPFKYYCTNLYGYQKLVQFLYVLLNNVVNYWDYAASMTDEWMSRQHWLNDTDRGKPKYSEETCTIASLSSTQASVVIGQQLTTWAMVWTGIGSTSVLTAQGMALDNKERLQSLILRKDDKNWYYNGDFFTQFQRRFGYMIKNVSGL